MSLMLCSKGAVVRLVSGQPLPLARLSSNFTPLTGIPKVGAEQQSEGNGQQDDGKGNEQTLPQEAFRHEMNRRSGIKIPPEYWGDGYAYNHMDKRRGFKKPTHTIEEQLAYMESDVFKNAYQGKPIWHFYRRNMRVQEKLAPPPRTFCIDKFGRHQQNNACPVCRDEYLFFDYRNPKLIEMFLISGTINPYPIKRIGLCEDQYTKLQAALLKAKEHGTITFDVPFRRFNYKEWYGDEWRPSQLLLDDEAGASSEPLHEDVIAEEFSHRTLTDVEEIYPDPPIDFEVHERDLHRRWDEWWRRHARFSRKGQPNARRLGWW